MIEDKELDKVEAEIINADNIVVSNPVKVEDNTLKMQTGFSKAMDVVKENVLDEASTTDKEFVQTIKENVKQAAVKLTEVEKDKADYQQQQVKYESEKLETEQKKNIHTQSVDKWENRQRRRQYHYDGVKPIMEFVGIKSPLNLFFLYFFAIILTPIYLVAKFINGTFGALLAGASDGNRGKMAKGFLWTLLCVLALVIVACLVWLFLRWQGIIEL